MAEEENNVGISLGDIAACVHIIDIVSKRGAFEGPELADVGVVRNKLTAFLEANTPAESDTPAEEEAEAPAEE